VSLEDGRSRPLSCTWSGRPRYCVCRLCRQTEPREGVNQAYRVLSVNGAGSPQLLGRRRNVHHHEPTKHSPSLTRATNRRPLSCTWSGRPRYCVSTSCRQTEPREGVNQAYRVLSVNGAGSPQLVGRRRNIHHHEPTKHAPYLTRATNRTGTPRATLQFS